MKTKLSFTSILLLVIVMLFSCKGKQLPKTDAELVTSITQEWSDALNNNNIDKLNSLYSNNVLLYGISKSKYEVLAEKDAFLKQHTDFSHTIKNIKLEELENGNYKTTFDKVVKYGDEEINVNALLVLEKQGDAWKIVLESDEPTEAKIKREADEKEKNETAIVQTVQFEDKVKLKGVLEKENYTDLSNNTYTIYIVKLDVPVNVNAPNNNYKPLANVTEIQVGFDDNSNPEKYYKQDITISGEIYGEETIHDRRPVVMIRAIIE